MINKSILLIALSAILATTAFSRQVGKPETKEEKKPKLVVGLSTGPVIGHLSNGYNSSYFLNSDINLTITVGIFTRYYMGKHLAIELGANIIPYKKQELPESNSSSGSFYNHSFPERTVKPRTIEVPISFQYHIGKPTNRLRPYLGIGAGYCINRYNVDLEYDQQGGSGTRVNETFIDNNTIVQLNIAQGLTYQITPKLQFSQLLKYSFSDIRTISLNLGVGYTIGK